MTDLKEVVKDIEWLKGWDGKPTGQLFCFAAGEGVGRSVYSELVKQGGETNDRPKGNK